LALLVICAALLLAVGAEAWTRHTIEQQVAAARARNAALQRDVTTTQQNIRVAESPSTIEREARAWGYIRSGDHPVIVAPTGSP
jgi:cell division protein FtsB